MKITLALLALVVSLFSYAGEAQIRRFEPWLADIEASLKTSDDPEVVAEHLHKGTARGSAFYLQALGRLYKNLDEIFQDIHNDFEDLEDILGDYDYASDRLGDAEKRKDEGKIEEWQKEIIRLKKRTANLLRDANWLPTKQGRIEEIREQLRAHDWPSYVKDKKFVIGRLTDSLQKLITTEFDMSRLEKGDGLHELRRELRWIAIEARALNGLIQFREDKKDCPIKKYSELPLDPKTSTGKYRELPADASEKAPCQISQCLFLALVEIQEELAKLKDKAESDTGGESNRVPKPLRKKAEALYEQLTETKLLEQLQSQLKACTK